MSTDKILSRKDGPVGVLVFNNPERRNAISPEMSLAAAGVLEEFSGDRAIRVIVLTGAGDKAFVSGADISKFESARATPEQREQWDRASGRFRDLLRTVGKPTIAMIRGYCVGGGLGIALSCDLRISAENGEFGIPAAKLGIGYAAEAVGQLVNLVGPSSAKDILYSGRRMNAQEALRLGLVNQVVAAGELEHYVMEYARGVAANAPLSLIAAKRVVDELMKDPERRDHALCQRVVADCFASQDYVEGRRAFMEKRKPVFTGT
ncbi:MAG: enoyl-CoA hydratase/isomerase family protein [Burkholderiales bacterium]|nr:enoyl-CoA hydratase/isomerase family protein [Burkholderiales bacterium]